MNTRFEIQVKIADESWILDIFDTEQLSTTYQASDIRDIAAINSNWTHQIKLPNTKRNREAFAFISELTADSTYNPNKRAPAFVIVDSVIVLEGDIQLMSITKDYAMDNEILNCIIFGGTDNFIKSLDEKFIDQLEMSEFNHNWRVSSMTQSWSKDYKSGYYYPLIDYGIGLIGNPSGDVEIESKNMFPATYIKTIFDKIFNEAGWSYQSDFLSNAQVFKDLLLPYGQDKLRRGPTLRVAQEFLADLSADRIYYKNQNNTSTMVFDNDVVDPANSWQLNKYVTPGVAFNEQKFVVEIEAEILYAPLYNGNGSNNFGSITFQKIFGGQVISSQILRSNIIGYNGSNPIHRWTFKSNPVYFSADSISNPSKYQFVLKIEPGNLSIPLGTPLWSVKRFTTSPAQYDYGSRVYNLVGDAILPGTTLDYNNILPKNIKQKDFVMWIIKMFNLVVEPVRGSKNTLKIEPYDEFYQTQNIKDWTSKVDINKPVEMRVMGETQNRTTFLTYKEGKDFYNVDYQTNVGQGYGSYRYELDNDFINGVKKIEVGFEPTPIVLVENTLGMIIPNIQKADQTIGFATTGIKVVRKNPTGLVNCIGNDKFVLRDSVSSILFPRTFTKYPYVGHFDHPLAPTEDINFGQTLGVWFPQGITTNNNLYYRYWQQYIEEFSDKDSRILTLEVYLTPEDIYNFKFNDLIYINLNGETAYYRVNKINNYDPTRVGTSTVELLKSKYYQIPRQKKTIKSVVVQTKALVKPPDGGSVVGSVRNNEVYSSQTVVYGKYNIVSEGTEGSVVVGDSNQVQNGKGIVVGSNNTVGGTSEKTLIFGDGNTITGNSETTFIVGDGLTITGNTSVINSPVVINSNYVSAGSDELLGKFSDNTVINYIYGSRDDVRELGSYTNVSLIFAGRDTIL
jgi:hypothetical protein